jgi:hypothetical protein
MVVHRQASMKRWLPTDEANLDLTCWPHGGAEPLQFLQEILIERVAVDVAIRVDAGARIAVLVPRPADVAPAS